MGKKRVIAKSGGEEISLEKGIQIKIPKKQAKKQVKKGLVFINASRNNTIVTITDNDGAVIAWASAGNIGFRGTKKSTPYAATLVGRAAGEKAKRFGFSEALIYIRGVGPGREAAARGLYSAGIDIKGIIEDTPVAHGGVKPEKPRRI